MKRKERPSRDCTHPQIHPIYNQHTQTILHMPDRFCLQDLDIALSCESMPMSGKYRSGCSQNPTFQTYGIIMPLYRHTHMHVTPVISNQELFP